MEIKKFERPEFGCLTVFRNEKNDVIMFLAKEVCNIWGHTNITQAIKSAQLSDKEYKVITLRNYLEFKNQLTKLDLVTSKTPTITMVTESGMYKLALASNLAKAIPFRDWVTSEVLPSIRKNGYYSIANQTEKILIHTNIAIQKQNSKDVNSKHFIESGLESVIEYNRKSCLLHTGRSPHDMKVLGRELGLKSAERTSAKEVLRHIKPEIACAMSFTDELVNKGFDLNTVSELSLKAAVPLFQGLIDLGIAPKELQ